MRIRRQMTSARSSTCNTTTARSAMDTQNRVFHRGCMLFPPCTLAGNPKCWSSCNNASGAQLSAVF
jgi:hypothetical protein